MFDRIEELKKIIDRNLQDANQDAFMHNMRLLQQLKADYKNSPDTFITKYTYENWLRAKKLNRVTRGGNCREALVEWRSLPISLQQHIIEHIGYNPEETQKNKTFEDYITHDKQAEAFFKGVTNVNDEPLSETQLERYLFKANVMNAIHTLVKERESKRMAFGKKRTVLFKNLAKVIKPLLSKHNMPARLIPTNYRRLMELYDKYRPNNYEVLLHKGMANDNSRKIKGEIADWLLSAYCLPNKPSLPVVLNWYRAEAEERGWPDLTEQAVNIWLNKPQVARKWVLARHGKEEWKRRFGHHVTRKRSSWFPNAYWAIDGSKLDWIYMTPDGTEAKMKIDIVVDVFSEKILGWSYSGTEDHTDHFKALKMAAQNAGHRPYLFTYDNQSGHKSATMQSLYDKLVARYKGVHYPHKAYAHNSPVENIFNRFQQQVLNRWWFSDKQSIKSRKADSLPNLDFLSKNKHLLKTKEELIKAFEVSVKLWNEAKHPKYNKTRNEVYTEEMPMREELSFLDMVDLFWVFKTRPVTYKRGGIKFTIAHRDYEYEVLDSNGKVDLDFRRKYVGSKFYIKYDPEHLSEFIQLYKKNESGELLFIANAEPKREHEVVPALMNEGDKAAWQEDYNVAEIELQREYAEIEAVRKRSGITPEKLIEEQEYLMKMGGELTKEKRNEIESNSPFARL